MGFITLGLCATINFECVDPITMIADLKRFYAQMEDVISMLFLKVTF